MIDIAWANKHDEYNLLSLPIICSCNILFISLPDLTFLYWFQYVSFLIYIICDTMWIALLPQSVGSPKVILFHHFICLFGWSIQIVEPAFARWISIALLVEISTFFIILRRYMKNPGYVVNALYWITWVVFRIIMYPLLVIVFYKEYRRYTEKVMDGVCLNIGLLTLILLTFLTYLNIKWTLTLLSKTFFRDQYHKWHL